MPEIVLKGITWNHSRGITPLQAASQRFTELHPDVEIQWHKRSLQQFADYPIETLTESYDLLIIDHPWVGTAAATRCVLPLDQYLSADYLEDQSIHSVGASHDSYHYEGHQWALAVDAATPAASYRADLMEAAGVAVPRTWEALLDLAQAGRVAVPAIPIDLLMNFYTFCIAQGRAPFESDTEVIDASTGTAALHTMKALYSVVDRSMFDKNPIAVAELMTAGDAYWYCPFAYAYSNYAREGYAQHRLTYTDVVHFQGRPLRTTIGGTGLSVSAFSKHPEQALAFASLVGSASFQEHGYVLNEGQPGHLKAWKNRRNNELTHHFFNAVLPAMEHGYLRPRYHGYLYFQDEAGSCIQQYLMGKEKSERKVLDLLNAIYKESIEKKLSKVIA